MIKGSLHQEDITIIYAHAHTKKDLKYSTHETKINKGKQASPNSYFNIPNLITDRISEIKTI